MGKSNKPRILTEMQEKFLTALYSDESGGDPRLAMRIAGYSENVSPRDVVTSLKAEIVDAALSYLALQAPKAAVRMSKLLDNPNDSGAANTLKVATEILNRAGAKAPEEGSAVKVPGGGLFIMPAKGSTIVVNTNVSQEAEEVDSDED